MRIDQITFTRFIAALSIVIYHFGRDVNPFNSKYTYFALDHANTGVSYFFILSGFIMIVAYSKSSTINYKHYLKNRFARIYPVYFLAIAIMLVYNLLVALPNDWTGLLLNIVCIQAWFPEKALSFNGPGWSLSVELLFYTIFPFLFNRIYSNTRIATKSVLPILLLFATTQLLFSWYVHSAYYTNDALTTSHGFMYYSPLMHVNEFLIGNLAGIYFIKIDKSERKNYDLHLIALTCLLFIALKYATPVVDFHDGLLAFIFIPFVLLLSLNSGLITRVFRKKLFVFLGEVSFGMYILQIPIFYYCKTLLSHFDISSKPLAFYTSFAVLLLVSAVSYVFIETPLRNKIKSLGMAKPRLEARLQ